ncbi:unnamed protein product [Darwinula stevensoni]|uniref:Uncharacterized protein n=1 Tax=Darwinula stevensoni TaxID=69355 RepID=A0A7R9A2K5_9CRUS|nr:unnamed protein product [Darwinula stevensoni]CAG0879698.1 unnamed protein product [Darwinula stevensoni]
MLESAGPQIDLNLEHMAQYRDRYVSLSKPPIVFRPPAVPSGTEPENDVSGSRTLKRCDRDSGHDSVRAENPVNLQAGFIISIIVSLILIHGVKNNNRFYFLPWVIWASLESIFTFSTLFFTIFVAANTEASAIVYVVIVLLVVVVALVYFLLLVLSYYLELRDQFYNQPENEPKPLDRIPA